MPHKIRQQNENSFADAAYDSDDSDSNGLIDESELDKAIEVAEAEYLIDGKLYDARKVLEMLKRKHAL